MLRGTWFVDELCRNNVRGSSAVRESVNMRVRRNQIIILKLCEIIVFIICVLRISV